MNEEKINQIKDKIRNLMRQITSMGEEPPEFIRDLLMKVLQKAKGQIQELRQQEQNEPPAQPPTIPPGQLESTPSNDAQLLWILAGQQPQAFISYLRTFPTPGTQQLLNDPSQLNATIEHLQQMMPQGEPPSIHGIPHADLNSSNVWGANYDPESGKMKVRFQGGSEYEYDGIPQNIFNAFIHGNADAKTNGQNRYGRWWKGKNPSLGAALNQYVKAGGFNYRKIR